MCNSLLINDVVIDWEKIDQGSYLRDIIAFSGVVQISFDYAVAFLAGENGSGKSTQLEAIAIVYGFNPRWDAVLQILYLCFPLRTVQCDSPLQRCLAGQIWLFSVDRKIL